MNMYFTADLHFGHERICELADRPFASVAEMDEALIERWNQRVRSASDIVWVLGDYALGDRARGLGYLARLNGRKMLIEGNHDRCWMGRSDGWKHQREYLDAGFEIVAPFARAKLPPTATEQAAGQAGRKVVLSHFPYALDHTDDPRHTQFRLRNEGAWLVHGHVHQAFTAKDHGVNVGVDRWDFTPVPATTVAALIENIENGTVSEDS